MSSILTNSSAMVALGTLKNINSGLAETQNQISTGLKISSAKDNAAIWSVATTMRSDKSGFDTIQEGLSLAESTVAVGRNAAEGVVDLLTQIKDVVITAQGDNVDHAKLKTEVDSLFDQVGGMIGAAQFNGRNILNAADDGSEDMSVLASLNRGAGGAAPTPDNIAVAGQNLTGLLNTVGGGAMADAIDFTDAGTRATALDNIETMIGHATDAAAALGSSESRLSIQSDFLSALSDTFENGISALVDTDMEEASAKLQSLQVQQQLGVQALSIANQSSQTILSLFR